MAKQHTAPSALDMARTAADQATERKAALLARLASAEAQHKAAVEAFDAAVMSAPADAPSSDHGAAAGLVQATEATATALQRGLIDRDAEIAAANAKLAVEMQADADVRWQTAVESHLVVGREIDALGARYAAAVAEWRESVANLSHCWPGHRVMASHEIEQLRDIRAVAWTVPADLQNAIVQTGSSHAQSFEAKTRTVWSQTVKGGLA